MTAIYWPVFLSLAQNEWLKLPNRFQNIQLHEYVVMPNHFHVILEIVGATLVVAQNDDTRNDDTRNDIYSQKGQPQGIAPTKTVGDMMDNTQNDYLITLFLKNKKPVEI